MKEALVVLVAPIAWAAVHGVTFHHDVRGDLTLDSGAGGFTLDSGGTGFSVNVTQ